MRPTLLWFRQDLRLEDNPALAEAVQSGRPIIPVYIWAPEDEGDWPPGAASRWWLHHSLAALDRDLHARGSRLILRTGPAIAQLAALVEETGAECVLWNRRYEPAAAQIETELASSLARHGINFASCNSALLLEPHELPARKGGPYRVFTPFWKAATAKFNERSPDPAGSPPARLSALRKWPKSISLKDLHLLPTINWAAGLRETWTPGEAGAQERLQTFIDATLRNYATARDRPAVAGTSMLSPHLHWGEIGPRQVWRAVIDSAGRKRGGAEVFLRELGWREFAYHLLRYHPDTPTEPLNERFSRFRWSPDYRPLAAWKRGRTGYPLVDAGMRQLWRIGWMHNRVRMVVASFLVKHLLLPWQEGARWFWGTLVDADLANNTLGWQWSAGCGADAAPYFRVFNPSLQAERYDPEGEYVRRWVPELAALSAPASQPSLFSEVEDETPTYPEPIVDHAAARRRALEAYAELGTASRQ